MSKFRVDLDDDALRIVTDRYGLTTKSQAVNLAPRRLAAEPLPVDEARRMRGAGWDGDPGKVRECRVA